MGEKEVQKGISKALRLCKAFCEQLRKLEPFVTEDEKKAIEMKCEKIFTEIFGE